MDVLDLDCRLVHKHTDCKRQSTEGHDVDRLTCCPQKKHSNKESKRDVGYDDERATPVSQEEKDNQPCQNCTERRLSHETVDRIQYIAGLIEGQLYINIIRHDFFEAGDCRFHRPNHGKSRCIRTLCNGDVDSAAAIDMSVRGDDIRPILDGADVT